MDIDIEQVRRLVELMVAHDLSRIEIREGEGHILLRRGQPIVAAPAMPASLAPPPALSAAVPGNSSVAAPTVPPPAPAREETELLIKSPMVGTFYASAAPDSPTFVSVGSVVGPETVVCIVEAMKVFNEIKAEVSGRITRILVKNAQAVEFDQPLFAVAPA
jgi:acetyl-CoA carboxylase biotin carboxyl carrier protein